MMMPAKIRVLIAEDSAFMRRVLRLLLSSDPQIEVVGEARDGVEAVLQSGALHPDVITMDINMPKRSGVEATEEIMSSQPRPIVIVSSSSGEAVPTLRALELGAIDFVAKPVSGIDLDMESVRDELLRKVKMAAKVRVVRNVAPPRYAAPGISANAGVMSAAQVQPRSSPAAVAVKPVLAFAEPVAANRDIASAAAERFPIVALAGSTGGPAALMRLLPRLPAAFPGALLLIQHMPANFTGQFGEQLATSSTIRVKQAEHGELMRPGVAYLCPGANHLRVSPSGRLLLDAGPPLNGYRPSIDLALDSMADYAGVMAIAVILSGMGNDGAQGVQAVRTTGGYVLAQDEATSMIFGMPSEAIKTGAVDQVLPLDAICAAIEQRASRFVAAHTGTV
jgi:two-component system chemotaxis response regulator CheB